MRVSFDELRDTIHRALATTGLDGERARLCARLIAESGPFQKADLKGRLPETPANKAIAPTAKAGKATVPKAAGRKK